MRSDSEEENFEIKCSLCEKAKLWYKQWKASEINSISLTIRDRALQNKFINVELLAVKQRWEISTVVFTVVLVIYCGLNWNEKHDILSFFVSVGDLFITLVLFSIIGIYCPKVHRVSVFALILVRSAYILAQIELVQRDVSFLKENFDYSAW